MAETQQDKDLSTAPMLQAVRAGLISDPEIARTIYMTHGSRVRDGINQLEDDCGGAPRVGGWKCRRSS